MVSVGSRIHVKALPPEELLSQLRLAGLEVFRADADGVVLAERVRHHLMEADVGVRYHGSVLYFVARAQRSDFPYATPEDSLDKVRGALGAAAAERGFTEHQAASRVLTDPVNPVIVLDVWHEITYAKPAVSWDAALADLRWALKLERYVHS